MYPFLIEKLTKHEISGHCFPYINKEFYEVNEALGAILQKFVSEYSSAEKQTSIDYNSMEYQTYVQLMIGKTSGEKIKTEAVEIQYCEGISCAISVLAPVFTITQAPWHATRYLSSNQEIETFPTPNYTSEEAFTLYQTERKLITNYLKSKGFISFQEALIQFPEINSRELFSKFFFICD